MIPTARRYLSGGLVALLTGLLLFTVPWSRGPMAAHGHQSVDASEPTNLIVHIADRVNVSATLQLASPQTIGIDRVRLLQSLMPYHFTVDTRIVSARRRGNEVVFDLFAPGRISIPVYLHLLVERYDELDEMASTVTTDLPVGTSRNSFRVELLVNSSRFMLLDHATPQQLTLLIAPM